jgi:hypothetical protein
MKLKFKNQDFYSETVNAHCILQGHEMDLRLVKKEKCKNG